MKVVKIMSIPLFYTIMNWRCVVYREKKTWNRARSSEQKHKLLEDCSKQLQTTVIISVVVVAARALKHPYGFRWWASRFECASRRSDGTAHMSSEKSHKLSRASNIRTYIQIQNMFVCVAIFYICTRTQLLYPRTRCVCAAPWIIRCWCERARTIVMHFLLKFNDSRSNEFRASRINYNVYDGAVVWQRRTLAYAPYIYFLYLLRCARIIRCTLFRFLNKVDACVADASTPHMRCDGCFQRC